MHKYIYIYILCLLHVYVSRTGTIQLYAYDLRAYAKLCIGMTCKANAGTFTRKLKCKSMDVHHIRTLYRGTHAC